MTGRMESEADTASIVTIVLMLSASAGNYLDEASKQQDPEKRRHSLDLARMTIDLLAALEEKTRGNLDTDERTTLDAALTQLRLQYVRLAG